MSCEATDWGTNRDGESKETIERERCIQKDWNIVSFSNVSNIQLWYHTIEADWFQKLLSITLFNLISTFRSISMRLKQMLSVEIYKQSSVCILFFCLVLQRRLAFNIANVEQFIAATLCVCVFMAICVSHSVCNQWALWILLLNVHSEHVQHALHKIHTFYSLLNMAHIQGKMHIYYALMLVTFPRDNGHFCSSYFVQPFSSVFE